MPYKRHPLLTVPAPATVIWRYLDFAKFVSMLETNSLWFTSLAAVAQDDHWEGYIDPSASAIWAKHLGGASPDTDAMRHSLHEMMFINCWHMNEHESDAMWKVYSDGGRTLAIRSTVNHLCDTLDTCQSPFPLSVGQVEYVDHSRADHIAKMLTTCGDIPGLNIIPPSFWKRPSYAHERELRAIYILPMSPPSFGIALAVDLRLLFEEIRVSPQSPEWFRILVEQIMARYGFKDVPVKRSKMEDQPMPTRVTERQSE
jgi:hypothetical protein